jgi:hypothetical protein
MAMEQQPPDVLAIVLADAVHRDLATGKNFIQGTFHGLSAASFPWTLPCMVVYLVLTEGYGETRIQLRLVDALESRPPIVEAETMVSFADPLTVMEVVFPWFQVGFPEPGEYSVQLFGAGEFLREHRLEVWLNDDPSQSN